MVPFLLSIVPVLLRWRMARFFKPIWRQVRNLFKGTFMRSLSVEKRAGNGACESILPWPMLPLLPQMFDLRSMLLRKRSLCQQCVEHSISRRRVLRIQSPLEPRYWMPRTGDLVIFFWTGLRTSSFTNWAIDKYFLWYAPSPLFHTPCTALCNNFF